MRASPRELAIPPDFFGSFASGGVRALVPLALLEAGVSLQVTCCSQKGSACLLAQKIGRSFQTAHLGILRGTASQLLHCFPSSSVSQARRSPRPGPPRGVRATTGGRATCRDV